MVEITEFFEIKDSFTKICGKRISVLTLASYIGDWVLYITIISLSITYGVSTAPRFQDFSVRDTNLWHVYKGEAATWAPIWVLILFAYVVPLGTLAVLALGMTRANKTRKLWDYFSIVTALTSATAMEILVVCVLKNLVGKPRPDTVHRCLPSTFTMVSGQMTTVQSCTTTYPTILAEGFRSFPSGHAATSFASATVQALFSMGRLRMFDSRGIFGKQVICTYSYLVAVGISASRVSDNRHFIGDVVAGMVIGITAGTVAYLLYFPPPFPHVLNCGKAYLPRRFCNETGEGGYWPLDPEDNDEEQIELPEYPSVKPQTTARQESTRTGYTLSAGHTMKGPTPSSTSRSRSTQSHATAPSLHRGTISQV